MSAEFVAAMEDVLDLYEEPYDPKRPKVNFDEASKQLIAETRVPLPATPGKPAIYDYAYQRNGTRNLFMFCEPQAGWQHIAVTEHRTMQDFAHQMQWLVDERYPEADMIRVVLDNLNTHKPASLYEAFAPAEARRLLQKLEFHYTPKHGSWLNMAEIELSILQVDAVGELDHEFKLGEVRLTSLRTWDFPNPIDETLEIDRDGDG
ncbi:MAG: IS630 family transposase, partial [Candidatus Tectimicrobiota bacterium]